MQPNEQQLAAVVDILEEDIVLGRLRPHQELVEDVLMQRFDIKRHLARAAILDLTAKGLVVKPRNKSARVKDYSPEEVHWIYDVRITLCRRAVETMPLPGTPELLRELRDVHAAHGAAVAERRLRDVRLHNDSFHDLVFGACGNPYLIADIERYNRLSDPIRSTGISRPEWLARAVAEHAAMVDAIERGDRAELSRLVVEHMLPVRDAWLAARQLLVPEAFQFGRGVEEAELPG
ncbi:HTH-type transcriptional repressor CsiR [Pigmentiphaga humi]|uniref:HTH-type transcriptional repressor CsiR n=1 Tax=Pigmentiphaga humi TaxID=2478468 RepID=A0A3P4B761_9BURK|nr:GntR family transcriptional regulator [Pigmentiphaga humi]VCU71450.1 HTH-type transcriptional repressor CsiR [Pigmentiphaga humi]